jgi:3-methyladenine DNA glycosylase AlkD
MSTPVDKNTLRQASAALAGRLSQPDELQGKKEPQSVLPLLKTLWDNGSFEERQIAGKVMERMAKKYPAECLALVPGFLPALDNWANCDNLACFGMEPIALQMTDEVLSLCEGWVRDENKWIRRFGVVVLRAFGKADLPERALKILGQVMTDRDSDVKKAIAWILRDLSKRHAARVFEFLLGWATGTRSGSSRTG